MRRNRFIECDLGIHFGNPAGQTDDHVRGIIRNNFFYRATGDTGISLNRARLVKIYNNTIMHSWGSYFVPVPNSNLLKRGTRNKGEVVGVS